MYSAEITAMDGKAVLVQNNGGATALAILGPKGGILARVWLDDKVAAQVATAIMKSYHPSDVTKVTSESG